MIEGRRANGERQQVLLQDLLTRCESVRPTSVSPIFLGVKQAIANLRAEGCKDGSQCSLWVSTDLEENGVRAIKERIDHARHGKEPLPKPLDNSGIMVTFCGFAQTAGRLVDPSGREIRKAVARDPHRDDRLQAVWRSMFTKPELVTFVPYCPKPNNLQAYEGAAAPRPDYRALLALAQTLGSGVQAHAFVNDGVRACFVQSLRFLGYAVVFSHGRDVDEHVIAKAVSMHHCISHFVLASGDADFCPLVDLLHARGIRMLVAAVPTSCSRSLIALADAYAEIPVTSRRELGAVRQPQAAYSESQTLLCPVSVSERRRCWTRSR